LHFADATLLVVDDDANNRYTLTRRLKREGYSNVLLANNGREALDALEANPVDLVLLDIMMPELNGYEVLERIKTHPRLREIPVIMISAVDDTDSVVRCIELGAEDYLPKPFNATLLRARVGASLEKKLLRDENRRQARRMEEELAAARTIQLGMVPSEFPVATPEFPVDIHAVLHPAFEVGGDLYDFFLCEPGTLCIAIADVSGKGAAAALFMARTKTLIRTVAKLLARSGEGGQRPADILAHVNEDLCRDNPTAMFATVFIGMIDLENRRLAYCNAGHNAPYLIGADTGLIALTNARGRALGYRPGFRYETAVRDLRSGETLFLFTDGITEADGPGGEFFESDRLERSLRDMAGATSRQIIDSVIANVREFAGSAPQSDDIAAMAVRLTG